MMTTTMTRGMLVMIALLTLVSVLAYSFFEWYVRVLQHLIQVERGQRVFLHLRHLSLE